MIRKTYIVPVRSHSVEEYGNLFYHTAVYLLLV